MNDQQPNQPVQPPAAPAPKSAMAIAGLVVGIVALVLSAVPIVNNFSALLAVLGAVFGVVGVVGCARAKRSGKGLAIAALIVNVLALIVVLASQSLYSAAIDEAVSGPGVAGVSQPATTEGEASQPASDDADYSAMAVGTVVELDNGLSVSVDAVQTGLVNYDGSAATGITVTYKNNGSSEASFNVYDWKGQDAQGAQRTTGYYSDAENSLSSGTLVPGGTVSGNVYFEGDVVKADYYASLLSSSADATWVLA